MPGDDGTGGPAVAFEDTTKGGEVPASPGMSPNSTLRGFDRSPSPTLKSMGSAGPPSSGFSFGRKTLGFWDKPNTVMMRNNVILHNTTGATGRAGTHAAPGPGARLHISRTFSRLLTLPTAGIRRLVARASVHAAPGVLVGAPLGRRASADNETDL